MRHALRVCILLAVTVAAGIALASCDLLVPKGDFNITVKTMSPSNPLYSLSTSHIAYVVNGIEGDTITLTHGMTYTFGINAPGHPFYISTGVVGGSGFPGEYTTGVTGSRTEFGLLTFTAPGSPMTLSYDCGVHTYMGGTINVQ
jgi:hypothetical protein